MTVYCDVIECTKNHDGKCKNRFATGEDAVKMHMNWMGGFVCTDMDTEEAEDEE